MADDLQRWSPPACHRNGGLRGWLAVGLACGSVCLAGCGSAGGSAPAGQQGSSSPGTATVDPSALAVLGEKIFRDESLSASGRMSCATCHDPAHAFAQPTASGVSLGGAGLDQPGVRNAPSLPYTARTSGFQFDSEGTPVGHPSARGSDGSPPMFTDFTYDNLGVPRNPAIPANADPAYFDLGLCGPERTDLTARADLCGAFKVPTLRNIALTAPYFHNGRFQTLQEVVSFYVRRDTNPEEWYPLGPDGTVVKFDDLPPQYRRNVNTQEVPYNRHPGDLPALSPSQIDDVVAFLQTLTDGYQP